MQSLKHISGIIILTFLTGTFYITDRVPFADENVYFGHAYSIYSNGVFGTVNKKTGYSESGARVAPLSPSMLAGIMLADKDFARSAECHLASLGAEEHNCPDKFSAVKYFQLILFAFCLGYIWFLLVKIFDSKLIAYLTVGLLLLSGAPFYFSDHFLTESLYLGPAFIFLLTLSIAIVQKNLKYTATSAIFLAFIALTRPTYLYLFYMLLLIFPLMFLFTKKYFPDTRSFLSFSLVFLIIFSLAIAPWMTRNMMYFDKFAVTVGYSDKPLSTRVAHNDMNNMEYLAGWVYWLPDFGDSLAEKLFGYENIHRLSFSSPESFYPAGRKKVIQRLNMAMDPEINAEKYSSRLDALLKIYIYPDMLNHAKVTLLLAWRGFFVEKYFALIGLFFLIWALSGGIKEPHARYFHIIILPPFALLFFQAAVSVSIPRYNLILLLPLSIAMSFGIMVFIDAIESWKIHK